ncbi:hypothetical protein FK178_04870 [Antarcticibacterium arcticum]|uniref:Uncharacterized protein n=1 Tax=Antarcticibacterium arcticum TaxID=2585771 RepID=A0A5B8YGG7_9FLAO|nr:hypothetical protein [Antarcticibacterium arcticum]QED37082.1 hypothetical protein FK178_04870 [Antarcticibacterium arcticum]
MKKSNFIILIICAFLPFISIGQITDENRSVTDLVLTELNRERLIQRENLDFRIKEIDSKISSLDESLKNTSSSAEKVEKLVQRVQILEEKQSELDKNVVSVYKYNYSSAVLNLASMEREIKPLNLFNSSREFYTTLDRVSNPMTYGGYAAWFKEFEKYIESNKKDEARLAALSHILNVTGNLAEGTPFTGMFAGSLFDGIGSFINSLGKRDRDLREKSLKMFKLTTTVSQFTHDKDLIETEWKAITKSLDELKELQHKAMEKNIVEILGVDRAEFQKNFTDETDAKKRTQYILNISKIAENKIAEEKNRNPENWKQEYYNQMVTVQNLKIRFGTVTFRIMENLSKYKTLISKYRNDENLKDRVAQLDLKLDLVKNSFESTFNPQDYIKASNEMYIVE